MQCNSSNVDTTFTSFVANVHASGQRCKQIILPLGFYLSRTQCHMNNILIRRSHWEVDRITAENGLTPDIRLGLMLVISGPLFLCATGPDPHIHADTTRWEQKKSVLEMKRSFVVYTRWSFAHCKSCATNACLCNEKVRV